MAEVESRIEEPAAGATSEQAKTNIKIGDKNLLNYFWDFSCAKDFDKILESHLIPKEFIEKQDFCPEDYKKFLYARADYSLRNLRKNYLTLK